MRVVEKEDGGEVLWSEEEVEEALVAGEGGTEKAEEGEAWEGVKEECGGEVLLEEEEDQEEEVEEGLVAEEGGTEKEEEGEAWEGGTVGEEVMVAMEKVKVVMEEVPVEEE